MDRAVARNNACQVISTTFADKTHFNMEPKGYKSLIKQLNLFSLRPATQKNYRSSIYLHCSDWLDIPESLAVLCKVRAICGINFKLHDNRRTFLTTGEKLIVPTYALKRLVNHSLSNDQTGQCIIQDIERPRLHMSSITNAFLEHIDMNQIDKKGPQPIEALVFEEINQLRIPLINVPIL